MTNGQLPLAETDMPRSISAATDGTVNQSWRDLIKVHPAAELFPMMSDAELVELGKDIVENGLKQWLVSWTPERVEEFVENKQCDWYLLDGRNRLEALERAITDPQEREEAVRRALQVGVGGFAGFPKKGGGGAKHLFGDIDPYEYVISANLHRRHLTRKQKRDLIECLLKANPERSDRETGRIAKVHHETVGTIRNTLELTGGIRQFEKTVGADGNGSTGTSLFPAAGIKAKVASSAIARHRHLGFFKAPAPTARRHAR
jgi:hypothetical protein